MATATALPPKTDSKQPVDPERPKGVVLPLALLVLLITALVGAAIAILLWIWDLQESTGLETQFIWRRFDEASIFGFELNPYFFWGSILFTVLFLSTIYVVWMYVRDSRAVGALWSIFLGALRIVVYFLLAGIFMLPALQTWQTTETTSKVLIFFDVSGSMAQPDDPPGEESIVRQTRLDKVAKFLDSSAFVKKIIEDKNGKTKNPVAIYAFGGRLDEEYREFKKDGKLWSVKEWTAWLNQDVKQWLLDGLSEEAQTIVRGTSGFDADKPATPEWANEWLKNTTYLKNLDETDLEAHKGKRDRLIKKLDLRQQILSASNYSDPLLSGYSRESNNLLAGIIIIGDGRSNKGSPADIQSLKARATEAKVPIFTIGVGESREFMNIQITDLRAPDQTPPEEKFQVRAEITGQGLANRKFPVILDIYKPNQKPGEDKPAMSITKPDNVFKADGGIPHAQVEFTLDPEDVKLQSIVEPVKSDGKAKFAVGEWKFVIRIKKVKGEAYAGEYHVSEVPAVVQIVDRPLRILLFAGGPTHDYQFCRTLFAREMEKKRVELSIFLQAYDPKGPRVQDVPPERLLKSFPHYLRKTGLGAKPTDDKLYNLAEYDVIIAYDPDWTKVSPESVQLVKDWVKETRGGLILVAGQINTYQLARGSNAIKLKPIIDLYPVELEDSRTVELSKIRTAKEPWRLNFNPAAVAEAEYLKLDDAKTDPLAGWDEFFYGRSSDKTLPSSKPVRGFYSFYPVKRAKAVASVVATFADPEAKIDDPEKGKNEKVEHPYIVTMFQNGRVVYLGSGETRRLRQYQETFHERFWTKLARYAAAGTLKRQSGRGVFVIGKQYGAGQSIPLEVKLRDAQFKPIDKKKVPEVVLRRVDPPVQGKQKPIILKLKPKLEGTWDGWFFGRFEPLTTPGKYEIELQVPDSTELVRGDFFIKESNPELDNTKPDFAKLREIASTVADLPASDEAKRELQRQLRGVKTGAAAGSPDEANMSKLFFDLKTAGTIPDYLTANPRIYHTRGQFMDLWDKGFDVPFLSNEGLDRTLMIIVIVLAIACLLLGITALSMAYGNSGGGIVVIGIIGWLVGAVVAGVLLWTAIIGILALKAWNQGAELEWPEILGYHVGVTIIGLFTLAAFLTLVRRAKESRLVLVVGFTLAGLAFFYIYQWLILSMYQSLEQPPLISGLMLVIVALLSAEWLTRKLLRLA